MLKILNKKTVFYSYLTSKSIRRLFIPALAIFLIVNANIDRKDSPRIEAYPSKDEAMQACENWKATFKLRDKLPDGWVLNYISCLWEYDSRQFAGAIIKDKTYKKFKNISEKNWEKCITLSTELQMKKPISDSLYKTTYDCYQKKDRLNINIRESLALKYFRY